MDEEPERKLTGPEAAPGVRYYEHEPLAAFAGAVFAGHGLGAEDAQTCAHALVAADLRGVWSHGLARVPMYCARLAHGAAKARPEIAVERVAAAAALVDGDDGLGLVVAPRAMAETIAIAGETGIGLAGVRRSGHFGMASLYVQQATEAGCLGFAFSNASPALPPFGAAEAFFGTSPIAFSAPCADGFGFLVDMALSVTARGKLRYAAQRGEPIPEGYALDRDGNPTTDGAAALEGVVLPVGEHKGAALSWMNDVLCGVLTGAAYGGEVANAYAELDRPQGVGHLFVAMRSDLFLPAGVFEARMAELDRRAKALRPARGVDEILAPGEPELRREARHRESGVPLTPDVVEALQATGAGVGVDWPFG